MSNEETRETADGGFERGKPFDPLATESSLIDRSEDYQAATTALPELGQFVMVGGHLDSEGRLYKHIKLRSMAGKEEDMLGARNIPATTRFTDIIAACTEYLSTGDGSCPDITDRNLIKNAIYKMPSGTRSQLLVFLRRTTHYRRHKDMYEMKVTCPYKACQKTHTYEIDLSKIETFEMKDEYTYEHDVKLLDKDMTVTWTVATGMIDQLLAVVANHDKEDVLTYSIACRLTAFNGAPLNLKLSDWLDSSHTKLKMSDRAKRLVDIVKEWTSGDRGDLRNSFEEHEPGIDMDIQFVCQSCSKEFEGALDVGQPGFFFPSGTSKRSKENRSS